MHAPRLFAPLLIATALLALPAAARAQNAPAAVTIDGLVAHTLSFTPHDLAWLPPTQLTGSCADGSQHTYAGIDLAGLLAAAGLQGADPLQSYVTVTGADGRSVLIAWEEVDRLATQHGLAGPVLAIDLDGAPLTDGGPIKLVWDGCPTARDVDDVQRITVGTLAPGAAPTAPPSTVDRATGLASAGLTDADLPGMTPRYVALGEGASSEALPTAIYRGYWADDAGARAIDSLRTFATVDAAQSNAAALTPSTLAVAFGCAPGDLQDAGAQRIGDGDDLASWSCTDNLGETLMYNAEIFRHGRIVVAVLAINAPGDGARTVTAWARTIDARLVALAQ